MTEQEILRKLSDVDTLVACDNEDSPFSVFRAELTSDIREETTPQTEQITNTEARLSENIDDVDEYCGVSDKLGYKPGDLSIRNWDAAHLARTPEAIENASTLDPGLDFWTSIPYQFGDALSLEKNAPVRENQEDLPPSAARLPENGARSLFPTSHSLSVSTLSRSASPEMIEETQLSHPLGTLSLISGISFCAESSLIEHYARCVVHLMQPVLHRENPFQTLYLPLAVRGLSELKIVRNSASKPSARVSIAHSLLCAAAIYMEGHDNEQQGLQQLIHHHRHQALVALRTALTARTDAYKDVMTAILSLVSADILDGGDHDHWLHLNAATRYQISRHGATLVSRETRRLNTICTMLRLFSLTTLADPTPAEWTGSNGTLEIDKQQYSDSSIEYLYGITSTITASIAKIYRLTQHLAFYKAQPYPEALLRACERLGDELFSYRISSETFSALKTDGADALRLGQAQAKAFHYASRIYYFRSIQKCPREALQLEQQETLAAMEEAENIKAVSVKSKSAPAPITWPAFVASCEATGEYRMLWDNWWKRVERYQMKNFAKQRMILQLVWAELDKSMVDVDWRETLALGNLRVIPV
ncbi:unnamed protein product [Penicillium olsonii]|nr:unnamed protein product [Penicillium olsonii]